MLLLILIFPPDVKENLDHLPKPPTNAVLSGWLWKLRCFTNPIVTLLALVAATSTRIYHLQKWLQPEINENFTSKFTHLYICRKQKAQQVC